MTTHADKTQKNKNESKNGIVSQKQTGGESAFQFVDNRPGAVAQRKLQEVVHTGPKAIKPDKNFSAEGVAQLMSPEDLAKLGADQEKFMEKIKPPTSGMNVWSVQLPIDLGPPHHIDGTATLYILGTQHSTRFGQIQQADPLLEFLTKTAWNEVYTEVGEPGSAFKATPASMKQALEVESQVKEAPAKEARIRAVARRDIKDYREAEEAISTPIDESASRLAMRGNAERSLALETEGDRAEAATANKKEGSNTLPDLQQDRFDPQQTHTISEAYKRGNEHKIWEFQQDTLKQGRDIQDTEERNKKWVTSQHGRLSALKDGEKILWIVGVSHVLGLLTRLAKVFPGAYITPVGGIHDEAQADGPKHPYGAPEEALL